ncbi:MAG: transcriptional regulator TrmB [Candidatus Nomurabacteria bacterium]|nr:transcriptional regulator TrmB [Candidatus Nomurabacteria bacterium]
MDYLNIIKALGLSEAEAKVYLAALTIGESLPKRLSEEALIKRPTLYKILPEMLNKGLLSETIKGKRRYLIAEDPENFLNKKQSELELLEKSIPELRLLLRAASVKPKIIFYNGIEGIKRLYMDNLRQKNPILEFVSVSKIHPEIEFHARNYYIPQRINKKINIKIIVSGDTRSSLLNLKTDMAALREVRIIDEKKFPIPLDCYIYGDNISFAVYKTDSEPIGVIIRSKEIATTLRSLFEYVWEGSSKK